MKESKNQIDILLVGTGAVGSYFGGKLAQTTARVSALCRSDFDVVKSKGIKIESYKGDFDFKPAETVNNAQDYTGQPDYIMVCLKALPEVNLAEIIRPVMGADTAIVLVQNGIEIEAGIAKAFPKNEIISAIAFIAVSRIELGVARHTGSGMINLGNYPNGISPKTKKLADLFTEAEVPCKTFENIAASRWRKMIWNASFNPISVLGGGADSKQMVETPESVKLVRDIMNEVAAIAKSTGNEVPEEEIEKAITGNRKMRPFKTSMLVDYEAGRPMEIDAILGNAITIAKKNGIPTPYMESLYSLLKLHEVTQLS